MDEGNIIRYVVYAIGEILLIVIGILIALQINSWYSFRQDRVAEKEYLLRMVEDLKIDTVNIASMIGLAKEKETSIEFLFPYVRSKDKVIIDTLQFIDRFVKSSYLGWAHYQVTTGTIEELRNTGDFRLIQNAPLRSEIVNYYLQAEQGYQRIEKRRGNYPNEIYRLVPRSEDDESYRSDLNSNIEMIELLRNSNLANSMMAELNLAQFIYISLNDLLENSRKLLLEIENEIENKFGD